MKTTDAQQTHKIAEPDFTQSEADAKPPIASQEEKQPYFQKFSDLRETYSMQWLVKGFIPLTGIGVLYGDSTSGKTFLAIELALTITRGQQFFGYRTKKRPVVYISLEDKIGFLTRLGAWEKANNSTIPDNLFLRLADFQLTQIDKEISNFPDDCLIIVDTLNASEPVLEENSSKEMGRVIGAMKRLSKAKNGFTLLVHHTGKDSTKGMRGHSSLYAALDTAIEVSHKQNIRSWRIDKNKHGKTDISGSFTLREIQLGIDEDGDPIISCVVQPCEPFKSQAKKLPQALQEALASLEHALVEAGTDKISIEKWQEKWRQEYPVVRTEPLASARNEKESERRSFNYRCTELINRKIVAEDQGIVRILSHMYTK